MFNNKKILNDPELKKTNDLEHKKIIENAKSYGISIKSTTVQQHYPVYQAPIYPVQMDPMMYSGVYPKMQGYYGNPGMIAPGMIAPGMMQQGMMQQGMMGHPAQMSYPQNYLGDQSNNFANNKNEDQADLFNKS